MCVHVSVCIHVCVHMYLECLYMHAYFCTCAYAIHFMTSLVESHSARLNFAFDCMGLFKI